MAHEIPAHGYFTFFQSNFPPHLPARQQLIIPHENEANPKYPLDVRIGVPLWKDIGMFLPEDVSNTAAGDDFQATSTHPHTEGDFYKRGSFSILCFCHRIVKIGKEH